MGEDLSQGAKIGIILIILCALIAIVFSIMSIMKNITTQGADELQHSLSSMTMQKFDDYDQRTISGAQVISAIKLFENQPFCVIVYNNRQASETNAANRFTKYGLQQVTVTEGTTNFQYNASTKALSVTNGFVTGSLAAGSFTYNNNRKDMNSKISAKYISNSSTYYSYLIKNTSGDVLGIMVDEV